MENHIYGTMNRDSYKGYNVWRIIWTLQCKKTHIEGTMYGDSYRGYNV